MVAEGDPWPLGLNDSPIHLKCTFSFGTSLQSGVGDKVCCQIFQVFMSCSCCHSTEFLRLVSSIFGIHNCKLKTTTKTNIKVFGLAVYATLWNWSFSNTLQVFVFQPQFSFFLLHTHFGFQFFSKGRVGIWLSVFVFTFKKPKLFWYFKIYTWLQGWKE